MLILLREFGKIIATNFFGCARSDRAFRSSMKSDDVMTARRLGSIDRSNYAQIELKSRVNPGRISPPLSVKGFASTSTSQSSR